MADALLWWRYHPKMCVMKTEPLIFVEAWNLLGEASFILPTRGDDFAYLKGLKRGSDCMANGSCRERLIKPELRREIMADVRCSISKLAAKRRWIERLNTGPNIPYMSPITGRMMKSCSLYAAKRVGGGTYDYFQTTFS